MPSLQLPRPVRAVRRGRRAARLGRQSRDADRGGAGKPGEQTAPRGELIVF